MLDLILSFFVNLFFVMGVLSTITIIGVSLASLFDRDSGWVLILLALRPIIEYPYVVFPLLILLTMIVTVFKRW